MQYVPRSGNGNEKQIGGGGGGALGIGAFVGGGATGPAPLAKLGPEDTAVMNPATSRASIDFLASDMAFLP